jgi:tRNA A37 threonylcarbamoyladenosine synthetase subunit TsaC/SUA5/YrdC
MSNRTPPRFVPTLTEVVKPSAPGTNAAPAPSQEQVIRRVMQRIDVTLERRLREAIASTVLEQTRSLAPVLREEIEIVVRETVAQAFAEEVGQPKP